GSSIGNFSPDGAVALLKQVRAASRGGALLIGVDAKKTKARLDAAYADALGVTAAFNLNALRHINRVVGAGFIEAHWRHAGFYNEAKGRIEMHLEAICEETIHLDGAKRSFLPGERIHSENSYKYARGEFEALLRASGYARSQVWSNAGEEFWVFLAR
ncbi:MAG: L-histidine N(alpha)-methyltransferase, partial [Betaproteobacteria bacterium]|nr:L-histidine N(alpha)-methyltransferase [Betaproteobacteria bacterium]